MQAHLRARFWLEAALASLCGFLSIVTVFWRDWVEAINGFNPDHGNGSFEWILVVGPAAAAMLIVLAARNEWRRDRTGVLIPS